MKKEDFNLKQQNQVNSIFLEFLITNLFAEHKDFSKFADCLPELTKSGNYEIDGIFKFTEELEIEKLKIFILRIFEEKNIKAQIAADNFNFSEKINKGDFLIFETKINPGNIQEEILNYDKLSKIQRKILKLQNSKKFNNSQKYINFSSTNIPNFFVIFFYNKNTSNNSKNNPNIPNLSNASFNSMIIYTDCKSVLRQSLKVEKVSVKTVVDLVDKVNNLENHIDKLNTKFEKLGNQFENVMSEFNKKSKEKEKEIEDLKEINEMQEKIIFNYKTINKSVSETYKMIEDVNMKNELLTEENTKLRKVCEMNTLSN